MSYKSSPISLDGACTAIHDNTLYAFSANGFASLPLSSGAKWTQLTSGELVTGAVCVTSSSALFVIGGTSDNATYNGLQKYDYVAKTWTSLTPSDTVLKNRKGMSASYITATDSFITYGGRTDGTYGVASETFSIKASEPYTVTSATNPFSYTLQTPIMVNWDAGEVLMAGGSTSNLDVIIYNAGTNTWRESGATLADPVAKITNKGFLQSGDDGSKTLYTFDLAQSPVRVTHSVIVDATGAFVSKAPTIVSARALDAASWPSYNSTFAPDGVSSDVYSTATDSNGNIFFITSDSTISSFSATKNSWVDVDSQLGSQSVLASEVSSTVSSGSATATSSSSTGSSSSSTTTGSLEASTTSSLSSGVSSTLASATADADSKAAAAASSSAAAAAAAAATSSATGTVDTHLASTNSNGLTKTEVAGAIMGAVLGFALLALVVFLYTRAARRKRGYTGEKARKGQHYPQDEKSIGMSNEEFIDSLSGPPKPGVKRSNTVSMQSTSSIGIFGGKQSTVARAVSPATFLDNDVHSDFKKNISKPIINDSSVISPGSSAGRVSITSPGRAPPRPPGIPATTPLSPAPVPDARRSSGWNKYWSGNPDDASAYSDTNRLTQDSATVPPLTMPREGRPELNRVATGSPTVNNYNRYIPAPVVATVERPVSDMPSIYSSGVSESVVEGWSQQQQQQQQNAPGIAMGNPPNDMSWLNLGEYRRGK